MGVCTLGMHESVQMSMLSIDSESYGLGRTAMPARATKGWQC